MIPYLIRVAIKSVVTLFAIATITFIAACPATRSTPFWATG